MIIIGAGGHGLSLAYHLVKKGVKGIILVEQGRIGYGSSSRNASRFRYHFYSKENIEFALEGIKYLISQKKKLKYNPLIYKTGYLWLLHDENLIENFKKLHSLWSSYSIGGKFLECREFEFLKVNRTCYFAPQDGAFHHDYILYSYYEEIKDKVDIKYAKVSKIMYNNGKITGIKLESGEEIKDDVVIVTAGAWSGELLKTANINLPIYPDRKEIFITEDVKFGIKPLVIDFKREIYFSHTLKGEIIGGIEKEDIGFKEFSISFLDSIEYLKRLREVVKGIEGIGILRGWSGYYEMTPDHSHVMGYGNDWPEGLFIDAGYSGHGMMFAPYAGKIMADLIADNKKNRFIQIFSPDRFNEEKLIEEKMVI
ncbi:NAD(P)/FAD-dependent oxidoreductase [Acidianus ambivalens]|uniref:FAD-dependent oxidoreductase n=1 Tax=Acidianus ambivalens TaxID=2283 RepID=A0A650CX65_ACIAM|nr:FAD-binding oxidoreductase [Acidianus ambivalens]MQL54604.1 FAD-dependent oxidoreductase [Acidianus ambivalens]QGR22410.1 FAD-dependent oxidoreductase [Acidianus ambivalens]